VGAKVTEVDVQAAAIEKFQPLLDGARWDELNATMRELAERLRGRTLWNVNSTARGGGVVELLSSLIPYDRGCGIQERWSVIDGSARFFNFTKRLHNLLHGADAGGLEISAEERREYESTLADNAAVFAEEMRRGDVAILHDPQVAGLVPALAQRGVVVVWRCHIGVDEPNDAARSAWRFLVPYLAQARGYVFSRRAYAWDGLGDDRLHIIAPTIDPFTVKNRDMQGDEVAAILQAAGMMRVSLTGSRHDVKFERRASLVGEPVAADATIVTQVSRWDRLKDPVGVLDAFARGVAPHTDSVLVLAGPAVSSVDDDPEQPEVLNAVASCRESLPQDIRSRVLIAQLPMVNVDENATMVNALQRRSDVVVQKSLAEGFGLTVAEAMWKSRPIVASRVGGIEDQLEDGSSGLLVDDPRDLRRFADAVTSLVKNRERAADLGRGARRRAIEQFLAPRHLVEQARLIMSVAAPD
jgi:trehalose synthase